MLCERRRHLETAQKIRYAACLLFMLPFYRALVDLSARGMALLNTLD